MDPLPISDSLIRQNSSADSFKRGDAYHRAGAVTDVVRRGMVLHGQVAGSQYTPYEVRVVWNQMGVESAYCDCPYDWGGWCKHVVALLLKFLYEPERVLVREPLEEQLAALDASALRQLLLTLVQEPAIARQIEWLLDRQAAQPGKEATGGRPIPIDQNAIRQKVRAAIMPQGRGRYYEDDWRYGGTNFTMLDEVFKQAAQALGAGDGASALQILEAITEELVDDPEMVGLWEDEEGYLLIEQLDLLWAEAILSVPLDAKERQEWKKRLKRWANRVGAYLIEAPWPLAVIALEEGWEVPALQRLFAGDEVALEDEPEALDEELIPLRLRVLESQGEQERYLALAHATGQQLAYLEMLVQLGRVEEVLTEGLAYLATAQQALALAQRLHAQGHPAAALEVGTRGLTLPSTYDYWSERSHSRAELGSWLSRLASSQEQPELALRAAIFAFEEGPSLAHYLRVQELAGAEWEQGLRERLQRQLRESLGHGQATEAIRIFLHEGLVKDAIAVASKHDTALLPQVMEAALPEHPAWVIEQARRQAMGIIERGQASHYDEAVEWLGWVQRACPAEAWAGQLATIREEHGRKYKLMGLLKARFGA